MSLQWPAMSKFNHQHTTISLLKENLAQSQRSTAQMKDPIEATAQMVDPDLEPLQMVEPDVATAQMADCLLNDVQV